MSLFFWESGCLTCLDVNYVIGFFKSGFLTFLDFSTQTCALTRPEPVRKPTSSPENCISRLVPVRNNSPELEVRAYFLKIHVWIGLTCPEPVRSQSAKI